MPEPELLLTGLVFGESPRWHDGRLWFSRLGRGRDRRGRRSTAGARSWSATSDRSPFCIDWLPDGRLLVVAGREGPLLRRSPTARS